MVMSHVYVYLQIWVRRVSPVAVLHVAQVYHDALTRRYTQVYRQVPGRCTRSHVLTLQVQAPSSSFPGNRIAHTDKEHVKQGKWCTAMGMRGEGGPSLVKPRRVSDISEEAHYRVANHHYCAARTRIQ
jgi:hypothetical protein